MPIDLATARARLDMWLDAEEKVSRAQSYTIGDRTLTHANLAEIRTSIEYWERKVAALEAGGCSTQSMAFVPVDD